ncbi:ADP-ribosylglycohydrolase family protein [Paraburkholderia sediminicola]|uniref:ADP-ribosylglycohydrolase family protein n=1 Tax=Paraburkholderia sediminicola TaxID=458836 RepID=UPI0038B99F8C
MDRKPTLDPERAISAYLGAAIGDALGWPFEGRAQEKLRPDEWNGGFRSWTKRSGTRFATTWEQVDAGEYSDDTQLILAVSRARICSESWWDYFATVELPFWTCYERGGGGATKRAASSWLAGAAPWDSTAKDVATRYFAAGGNGAAMRILPHCVVHANAEDFETLAVDVLTDAVTTHGHPRALVGSLAFAYVLWSALRRKGILEYGELIRRCIDNVSVWGKLPDISQRWPSWQIAAEGRDPDFIEFWESTTDELIRLLERVSYGLSAGALSDDERILRDVGALTPKTNGAGTTTAVSAIYLASRYAASPSEGVRRAASTAGADTDTLASMTASLLGAVNGPEWLEPLSRGLQDREYIRWTAEQVAFKKTHRLEYRRVEKRTITEFVAFVGEGRPESIPLLPIGGRVVDVARPLALTTSREARALRWKLLTDAGLSLFVRPNAMAKKRSDLEQDRVSADYESTPSAESEPTIGISLRVRNLDASRDFYERCLGLRVTGASTKSIRFGSTLALREDEFEPTSGEQLRLFVNVADVDICFERMLRAGFDCSTIVSRGKSRSFECRDPDSYVVEVFERTVRGQG